MNAGAAGTAWSGGAAWEDSRVVEAISHFVFEGGVLVGVNEPSAVEGYDTYFRLAHILGIDEDTGARVCHGRWDYEVESVAGLIPEGAGVKGRQGLYLTDGNTRVLADKDGIPTIAMHKTGNGWGIYLSSFQVNTRNTRMLLNLMLFGKNMPLMQNYLTDNPETECAWYPADKKLVLINNGTCPQKTVVETEYGRCEEMLEPYETRIIILA